MISNSINEILNEQINKEFHSGYLYLSMSAYMKQRGLTGIASWLKIQAREEVEHGLRIFDYLIDCNSFVTLKQIKMPEFEFTSILDIFKIILEHEECITQAILAVAKIADEECDRTTLSFLDWFLEEQIEEENNVRNIIKRLEIFGENDVALFMMDRELAERKPQQNYN